MSLSRCEAGYFIQGVFCEICIPGGWSPGGFRFECSPCRGMPENGKGEYTDYGSKVQACNYTCGLGVPNVKSNPHCYDPFNYALQFFGGVRGMVMILISVILCALLLLLRSRGKMGREVARQPLNAMTLPGISFLEPHRGVLRRFCGRLCSRIMPGSFDGLQPQLRRSLSGGEAERRPVEMQLPKEKLPFHVCRVYFHGDNRSQSPWFLDEHLPASVEQMVGPEQWQRLAAAASALAGIPVWEARKEAALGVLYPPLEPLYARQR
ncbi:unnamed protein product, partial [Polarella glacialis]